MYGTECRAHDVLFISCFRVRGHFIFGKRVVKMGG
jgi:hypothetical protein